MIWGWENSWFFFGALSVLLLLIFYLLKYKGASFYTQALFLWDENGTQEKSSSRLTLRRLPLSFFLEAAALMLMVCGGASLFVLSKEEFPPAVVLLNNAYSMTPQVRLRGEKSLQEYLGKFPNRRVTWVLCGSEPEILSRGEKKALPLAEWKGSASEFKTEKAMSWAKENFPGAEICLVTDRVPENYRPGSFSLFCCGSPGENIAIANAAVSEGRVLLEIRSYARQKKEVVLKAASQTLEKFTLDSGGSKLFNFSVGAPAEILKFSIHSPGDALEYDNEVTLIDRRKTAVSYTLGDLAPGEKRLLAQVLENNPDFRQENRGSEILFTSFDPKKQKSFPGHRLFFHRGKQSFLEKAPPFFDSRAELLKGLYNTALVWAFAPELRLPGKGIVFSSSGPLMSLAQREGRQCDIHLNLASEYSNLGSLPFWPGLFSNLAELCRSRRPGVAESNVKAGSMVTFNLSEGSDKVRYKHSGGTGELPAAGGRTLFCPEQKGLYTLDDGKIKCMLAVNPHVTDISDLRRNRTFTEGCEIPRQGADRRLSLSWIFIAAAAAMLALNRAFTGGRRGRK